MSYARERLVLTLFRFKLDPTVLDHTPILPSALPFRPVKDLPFGTIECLAVSRDGTRIATAGSNGLCLWDVARQALLLRRALTPNTIALAFLDRTLFSLQANGRLAKQNLSNEEVLEETSSFITLFATESALVLGSNKGTFTLHPSKLPGIAALENARVCRSSKGLSYFAPDGTSHSLNFPTRPPKKLPSRKEQPPANDGGLSLTEATNRIALSSKQLAWWIAPREDKPGATLRRPGAIVLFSLEAPTATPRVWSYRSPFDQNIAMHFEHNELCSLDVLGSYWNGKRWSEPTTPCVLRRWNIAQNEPLEVLPIAMDYLRTPIALLPNKEIVVHNNYHGQLEMLSQAKRTEDFRVQTVLSGYDGDPDFPAEIQPVPNTHFQLLLRETADGQNSQSSVLVWDNHSRSFVATLLPWDAGLLATLSFEPTPEGCIVLVTGTFGQRRWNSTQPTIVA